MTYHFWHILLALTVAYWLAFTFWPRPSSGGNAYSAIGDGLVELLMFLFSLVITLVVWLIYFAFNQ